MDEYTIECFFGMTETCPLFQKPDKEPGVMFRNKDLGIYGAKPKLPDVLKTCEICLSNNVYNKLHPEDLLKK